MFKQNRHYQHRASSIEHRASSIQYPMAKRTTSQEDRYSKALLRLGKVAPGASPVPNAKMLRVDHLRSNPRNPRLHFNKKTLEELGESLLNVGVIEPLVVRFSGGSDTEYEIVVGERRWRAAKLVGITELPCLVRELDDVHAFEIALSENVVREELSPLDEAKCYQHMLDMGMATSLRQIGRKLGLSHTRVQQKMNLLGLERDIQRLVATRVATPSSEMKITEGHARHLLRLESAEERRDVLNLIFQHNWSTRETQAEVARRLTAEEKPRNGTAKKKRSRQPRRDPTQTSVESSNGAVDIHIQYDDQSALVKELESLLKLARAGDLTRNE
ncbi:MAG: ParB/RepB/Spo0J family partition protein [Planctomycetota bacterium]|nr:ParB/RepB/Spo0J family partition protein [Planctomycetota bacterium]